VTRQLEWARMSSEERVGSMQNVNVTDVDTPHSITCSRRRGQEGRYRPQQSQR
jgi:hypothetical protein